MEDCGAGSEGDGGGDGGVVSGAGPADAITFTPRDDDTPAPIETIHWAATSDFYHPPTTFPKVPGRVLRTQSFTGPIIVPAGAGDTYPMRGTRVMYTSTQSDGVVTTTTGALLQPSHKYNIWVKPKKPR